MSSPPEVPAVGGLAEHHAVEVEEDRRAADQGRERREDGLEALLFEHDLGELLVHREAALQKRVLLVDDLRGHRLGDGDERHVVRHLEQRETVLLGDLDERRRHLVEAEAGAEAEPGEVVVDEQLELLDLPVLRADEAVAGGEEELAALEPLGRVGDLGDVHPAHRVAGGLGAGQQSEVQVGDLKDVLDADHRCAILHHVQVQRESGLAQRWPQAPCTFWHAPRARSVSVSAARDPAGPPCARLRRSPARR